MPPKITPTKVFEKAKPIPGRDPTVVRQDPYGKTIRMSHYGQPSKPGGWDIDHIKPASRGGSSHMVNLQALNCHTNRSKGNSLVKKSRHNQ